MRFGSWIGGDRDGNPHVTPEVTRRACLLSRWVAADLYLRGDRGAARRAVARDAPRRSCARSVGGRPRALSRAACGRCAHGMHGDARVDRSVAASRRRSPPPGPMSTSTADRSRWRRCALCHRSLEATGHGLDRRRAGSPTAAARRGVRRHAGAARHPAGCGAPHRGARRDHVGARAWDRTPTGTSRRGWRFSLGELAEPAAAHSGRRSTRRPRCATCSTRSA